MNKEELINDIKLLISTNDDDKVDINPNFLEYFQLEELIAIKERLIVKKNNIREDSYEYLDEIYEKTKEDSI
ncbi:hypothetical protein [Halarcobacter bivalviorum]|uniref:DUF2018 domain-containing protein n=1 Tax=Halarcobacter bivalviorum TaxID=663364 RepID=A0AAX2AAL1_9BACT|nr:hypothetical protein [Halarcobacter bivalviorum]AXH12201.1 hypothetical protein ABIV_1200 [Halarcobacter bivalviorum]RXK11307.1 hypothetical protein CRV05_02765 [Halarcobacter bivalviorum]